MTSVVAASVLVVGLLPATIASAASAAGTNKGSAPNVKGGGKFAIGDGPPMAPLGSARAVPRRDNATGEPYVNYLSTQPEYTDGPNFICTGPVSTDAIDCMGDTIIQFASPVSGLTFNAIGVNDTGQVALLDVFSGKRLLATVAENGNGSGLVSELQDLSKYSDVTALSIYDITDGGGIGWNDFSFVQAGHSVEINFNSLPQGPVTGQIITDQFPSATFSAEAPSTTDPFQGSGGGGGHPPKGLVLAFGDSVSAGEGDPLPSGFEPSSSDLAYSGYTNDGQWSDSPDSYPALLAESMGWSLDNFSISGACAGPGTSQVLANCTMEPSVIATEIPKAQSLNLNPGLITLTVGADDVDFKGCFESLVSIGSASCGIDRTDLKQLKTNLVALLEKLQSTYPGVPILFTSYYDPFPSSLPTKNKQSLCHQTVLAYALYQAFRQHDYLGAARTLISHDVGNAAGHFFANVLSKAQQMETQLNATLVSAAAAAVTGGLHVVTVSLAAGGHDLCQDYPGGARGWVLGPGVSASASVGPFSYHQVYSPSDVCATPDAGCRTVALSESGRLYSFSAVIDVNDVSHPTVAGQHAFAREVEERCGTTCSK